MGWLFQNLLFDALNLKKTGSISLYGFYEVLIRNVREKIILLISCAS